MQEKNRESALPAPGGQYRSALDVVASLDFAVDGVRDMMEEEHDDERAAPPPTSHEPSSMSAAEDAMPEKERKDSDTRQDTRKDPSPHEGASARPPEMDVERRTYMRLRLLEATLQHMYRLHRFVSYYYHRRRRRWELAVTAMSALPAVLDFANLATAARFLSPPLLFVLLSVSSGLSALSALAQQLLRRTDWQERALEHKKAAEEVLTLLEELSTFAPFSSLAEPEALELWRKVRTAFLSSTAPVLFVPDSVSDRFREYDASTSSALNFHSGFPSTPRVPAAPAQARPPLRTPLF